MAYRTAKYNGHIFINSIADRYENMNDAIFYAMQQNPYKSEKARKDFIEGASESANFFSRRRTRKQIYG